MDRVALEQIFVPVLLVSVFCIEDKETVVGVEDALWSRTSVV